MRATLTQRWQTVVPNEGILHTVNIHGGFKDTCLR